LCQTVGAPSLAVAGNLILRAVDEEDASEGVGTAFLTDAVRSAAIKYTEREVDVNGFSSFTVKAVLKHCIDLASDVLELIVKKINARRSLNTWARVSQQGQDAAVELRERKRGLADFVRPAVAASIASLGTKKNAKTTLTKEQVQGVQTEHLVYRSSSKAGEPDLQDRIVLKVAPAVATVDKRDQGEASSRAGAVTASTALTGPGAGSASASASATTEPTGSEAVPNFAATAEASGQNASASVTVSSGSGTKLAATSSIANGNDYAYIIKCVFCNASSRTCRCCASSFCILIFNISFFIFVSGSIGIEIKGIRDSSRVTKVDLSNFYQHLRQCGPFTARFPNEADQSSSRKRKEPGDGVVAAPAHNESGQADVDSDAVHLEDRAFTQGGADDNQAVEGDRSVGIRDAIVEGGAGDKQVVEGEGSVEIDDGEALSAVGGFNAGSVPFAAVAVAAQVVSSTLGTLSP
jgi:hypothetical protein